MRRNDLEPGVSYSVQLIPSALSSHCDSKEGIGLVVYTYVEEPFIELILDHAGLQ